jgi:hypothetical protein
MPNSNLKNGLRMRVAPHPSPHPPPFSSSNKSKGDPTIYGNNFQNRWKKENFIRKL